MFGSYAIGLIAILVLIVAWAAVQGAWRRTFADAGTDPDPLAGRLGCHGCEKEEGCERRVPERTGAAAEEQR